MSFLYWLLVPIGYTLIGIISGAFSHWAYRGNTTDPTKRQVLLWAYILLWPIILVLSTIFILIAIIQTASIELGELIYKKVGPRKT